MFLFLLWSSSVKLFRYPFHSLDSRPPTPFWTFHLCSQQVFHSTHFLPALWAKGTIKLTHSKYLQNTWSLYDSSIKMEICFLPPQPSSLQHCSLQQTCSLLPCQSNTGRAQLALSLGINRVQPQLSSVSTGQWCRMTVTPPLASWPPLKGRLEQDISAPLGSCSLLIHQGWCIAEKAERKFSILFLKFTIYSMS